MTNMIVINKTKSRKIKIMISFALNLQADQDVNFQLENIVTISSIRNIKIQNVKQTTNYSLNIT